ncbi:hypothetical protein GGI06_003104 [Coemansia sp. S85]|nr:hypothetical protein GGI06_003104 [Coemansia sp. S85]
MVDAYYQTGVGKHTTIEIETENEGALTEESYARLTELNTGRDPNHKHYLMWMYLDSEYMFLPLESNSTDVTCVIGLWKATYDNLGDINSCADDIKGEEPYDEQFGLWVFTVLLQPKFVSYFYPASSV